MIHPAFATRSRLGVRDARLLVICEETIRHHRLLQLPDLLPSNSLVIVNTAATLPARFDGYSRGEKVELRLVQNLKLSKTEIHEWKALLYHRGSWRQRTEDRHNPDFIEKGDIIVIGDLRAKIKSIDHPSKKLITIRFQGRSDSIWNNVYRYGKPIQYSHLEEELELWDVQTIFSSVPVAVEPSSASFQLSWELINRLIERGIEITGITHGTSISSTGISELDSDLPLPEYYWIANTSADIINRYYSQDRPIIAIGTSVTRALEDNMERFSVITPGRFITDLKITEKFDRQLVSGLFTGMHLPEESHLKLLHNFVNPTLLRMAYEQALENNYLWHEYGDVNLILP